MSQKLDWSLPNRSNQNEVLADDWPWYAPLLGAVRQRWNGKPLDKQKFLIFDFSGNFEYHELHTEEAEVKPTKSLAQKRFEAWVILGAAAQRKFENKL